MNLPNLDYFGSLKSEQPIPDDFGARLKETFQSIVNGTNNTESQGNTNPTGQPQAPPPLNGIMVAAANGFHTVALVDQNPGVRRGINYWLERDTNPNFTNPHVIDLGQSRMHQEYLGNDTYYWRGHSSYGSSASNGKDAVYWGSAARPTAVSAGGTNPSGMALPSQGSGTGAPGQGLVGPGPQPVRNASTGVQWTGQQPGRKTGFQGANPPGGFAFDTSTVTPGQPGTTVRWVIEDTIAHQTNYKPAAFPNALYIATDTFLEYYSSGVAWIKLTPAMGGAYPANDLNGNFPNPPLNATGVSPSTYGNGTNVGAFTVDAKGRISAAGNVAITFPALTSAAIIAALGYTPAVSGANLTSGAGFTLTANLTTGAVTGTITQA